MNMQSLSGAYIHAVTQSLDDHCMGASHHCHNNIITIISLQATSIRE
jgi:hypothetical protein